MIVVRRNTIVLMLYRIPDDINTSNIQVVILHGEEVNGMKETVTAITVLVFIALCCIRYISNEKTVYGRLVTSCTTVVTSLIMTGILLTILP